MDRRNLLQLAATGALAGIILPKTSLADCSAAMAGGVYHTREAQGRWQGKANSHLPTATVIQESGGVTLRVVTAHGTHGYSHYIIKHIILNKEYGFMAEKMFDPAKDKAPVSEFSLGRYSGPIHLLSVCNKHDTWLNTITI